MSIVSALAAERTNEMLKQKAVVLRIALEREDWLIVEDMIKWMESEPDSE